MTDPKAAKASPHFVDLLAGWRRQEADLVAGKVLPTYRDRRAGHSPFQGSALIDFRQLVDIELERDQLSDELRAALESARSVPSASAIWAAAELAIHDLREALVYHAALRAHRPAVIELLAAALQVSPRYHPVGWFQAVALAVGLLHSGSNESDSDELEVVDCEEARENGRERLGRIGYVIEEFLKAAAQIDSPPEESAMAGALSAMKAAQEQKPEADPGGYVVTEIGDIVQAMLEDRADIRRDPTLKVLPQPDGKLGGAKADIYKSLKPIVGQPLRLVSTRTLAAARETLRGKHPHMHDELDRILATQSPLESVRLNVLLVSGPGMGKTTLARDLCDAFDLSHMTYSCAGASDAAFSGTSAQWHNARPSIPMQLVGRSKTANPCVILDEIDKIAESRHNGNLSDALLGFLERSSSKSYFDIALEQEVDLSAMSYIATANVLEDVPSALRDRFKIVRVPEPNWQHIGPLSRRIMDDIAKDRGLDIRWHEDLAGDEIEMITRVWPGGSIRQLQRIITMIVDGRDNQMARA